VGHDEVRDDAGDPHPAARDLLDAQRVGQQRLTEAGALFLAPVDDLQRALGRVLELGRHRQDLLVRERPGGLEHLGLILGQSLGLAQADHRFPFGWSGEAVC